MKYTKNYKFKLPELMEQYNLDDHWNSNTTAIDNKIKEESDNNKEYADSVFNRYGRTISIYFATTTNIPDLNNVSTIDGNSINNTTGKFAVLVKDQNDPKQNGIYFWQNNRLTRNTDYDTFNKIKNVVFSITHGSNNSNKLFYTPQKDDDFNLDEKDINFIEYKPITSAKIAYKTILSDRLADYIITDRKIFDNTITGRKIANNTITGSKIANNTITGSKIADKTITKEKIDEDFIQLIKLIAFEENYPVDTIYMTLDNRNPREIIGFGTWKRIGQNRVLWGGDGTNTGAEIEAGIPNIAGYLQGGCGFGQNGGAFKFLRDADSRGPGSYRFPLFLFNATLGECGTQIPETEGDVKSISYNNKVYGKSDTVQPPALVVNMWQRVASPDNDPVVFTCNEGSDFSIRLNKVGSPEDISLVYSLDNIRWEPFEIGMNYLMSGPSQKLYIKASNGVINRFSSGSEDYYEFKISFFGGNEESRNITLSGNINSLLGTHYELQDYCFYNLFNYCTELKDASELKLPATTLTPHCYERMFCGCRNLVRPPILPATTLAPYCYSAMFRSCSTLEYGPKINSSDFPENCCEEMFYGCTKIDYTYDLIIDTISDFSCIRMFYTCVNLTFNDGQTLPQLNATKLGLACYKEMFNNCSGLEIAPQLPATTLANECYKEMFYGAGIKTAPQLPATTLANECYEGMFQHCSQLVNIPKLPATTLPSRCYAYMFYLCSKVKVSATKITTSGINNPDTYTYEYRIPTTGSGSFVLNNDSIINMFSNTGGTFNGMPQINTTYYLSNQPV